MKEATGELNMTVITVVAIAAVGVIFVAFVLPAIRNNIERSTYCANAVCTGCNDEGSKKICNSCTYYKEDGTEGTIKCTFNKTDSTID